MNKWFLLNSRPVRRVWFQQQKGKDCRVFLLLLDGHLCTLLTCGLLAASKVPFLYFIQTTLIRQKHVFDCKATTGLRRIPVEFCDTSNHFCSLLVFLFKKNHSCSRLHMPVYESLRSSQPIPDSHPALAQHSSALCLQNCSKLKGLKEHFSQNGEKNLFSRQTAKYTDSVCISLLFHLQKGLNFCQQKLKIV